MVLCLIFTGFEITCEDGTYNNQTGATQCTSCPAGLYCVNTGNGNGIVRGLDCPPGHYCPEGTNATIPKCPVGTFNDEYNMQSEDDCLPCLGECIGCRYI